MSKSKIRQLSTDIALDALQKARLGSMVNVSEMSTRIENKVTALVLEIVGNEVEAVNVSRAEMIIANFEAIEQLKQLDTLLDSIGHEIESESRKYVATIREAIKGRKHDKSIRISKEANFIFDADKWTMYYAGPIFIVHRRP